MMRVLTMVRKLRLRRALRGIDLLLGQKLAQLLATAVSPDQADDGDVHRKFAQIARDVGGAAGIKRFPVTSTTGTGASGEMRPTLPQTNSSSIRSPMTRMRFAAGAAKNLLQSFEIHRAKKESRPMPPARRRSMRLIKIMAGTDLCGTDFCLELLH